MGKRPNTAQHKQRYEEEDSDDDVVEEEEELEKEPLKPEQLAVIQSRKKLTAKRRVVDGSTSSSSGGFTPFSAFSSLNKPSSETTSLTGTSTSVFSGFKGFSSFKTSDSPLTTSTLPAFSSTTSIATDKPSILSSNGPLQTSLFSSITPTTKTPLSTSNGALNQKTNEIIDLTVTAKKEDLTTNTQTKATTKNINESELQFINELNDLYEKCYGHTNRSFKLPSSDKLSILNKDDESEDKYAFLLAELNKNVTKWISKHVEENPIVILTPVFVDYFNYLLLLEKEFFPNSFKQYKSKSNTLNTSQENNENKEPAAAIVVNGHNNKKEEEQSHKNHNNKESEIEINKIDTSKTFANINKSNANTITATPSINLFNTSNSNTTTTTTTTTMPSSNSSSLFSFKPLETNATEKQSTETTNSSISGSSSLFKFGSTNSISSSASSNSISNVQTASTTESPIKSLDLFAKPSSQSNSDNTSSEPSKLNLFSNLTKSPSITTTNLSQTSTISSSSANLSSVAPSFKFGSSLTTTTTASPVKQDDTKKDETKSNFFSFLNKPANTDNSSNEETNKPLGAEQQPSTFKSFQGFGSSNSSTTPSASIFSAPTTTVAPSPFFSFGANKQASTSIFGSTPFGSGGDSNTASSIFGNSNSLTSFGTGAIAPSEAEADEEPYEPPKPEASEVKEDGSVFEKRVKLYYFSDKEKKFCDRGIGNLFIKPINNGESTSLIVRADTALANILLNVKLSKLLPVAKAGPKDVTYLCAPNPPIPNIDSKVPCKFLFKVKTEGDADELLEKLNEYKK